MNPTQTDNSSRSPMQHCSEIPLCNYLLAAFLFNYILLVPLFAYVPFIAYQTRRRNKSSPHSDVLTFNCLVFEFINIVSLSIYCGGSFGGNQSLIQPGITAFSIICCGQTILHVVTCVERHVAVVHPVAYMKRKRSGAGVRIGNASIAFVWLCCVAGVGFVYVNRSEDSLSPQYGILAVCVAVVSYCSVTVLCALVRNAPGENARKRRLDPSKKKAFKTIMFILAALLLRLVGIPVRGLLFSFVTFESCLWASVAIWMNLPSSLVLPLLYLQRKGKLPGKKTKPQDK